LFCPLAEGPVDDKVAYGVSEFAAAQQNWLTLPFVMPDLE
jgi:hypothetical protein